MTESRPKSPRALPVAERRRWRRLTVASAGVLLLAQLGTAGERVVLEAVMVRVNDQVVTISDFRARLRQELSQLAEPPAGEALRGYAAELLETLGEELMLLERAQEKRVQVEDTAVEEAIRALRQDNNLADDAAFAEALAGAGLTVEALRQRYRQSILLHRVVQSEVKPTEITEEELRRMYETEKPRFAVPAKVELEQLSFTTAPAGVDLEAVTQRARGLVERVRQGSDLVAEATLAGVEVQSLGAIPEADLRSELAAALAEVTEGGLTDPITYPGGLQVIRLVRRIPAGFRPFEEVRESLRRKKSEQSYREQTQGLVERLKHEYLVEVHREHLPQALAGLG